jgi:hypothetical protein
LIAAVVAAAPVAFAQATEPKPAPAPPSPAQPELPPPPAPPLAPAAPAKPDAAQAAQPAQPPAIPAPAKEPTTGASADALSRIIDRPHTIADLELGIIALPGAPVSRAQQGGDTVIGRIGRGDATGQIGIHVMFRSRELALGAGAFFAPSPTSDAEYGLGGQGNIPRSHSRSYFFLGPEGRYIPVHYKFAEAWVGFSAGAVIVADRFTTDVGDNVPTILGTREVTIRTEGLGLGLQGGGSYWITENWIAGMNLRGYTWFLPEAPRCSSLGDCATLRGTVFAFNVCLTIGYRLPL